MQPDTEDSQTPAPQDDELQRAIAAAKEAGLQAFRIETAPDGTVSIVVGNTPQDD